MQKFEDLLLDCELSEEERTERALALSKSVLDIADCEKQKTDAMKTFKERLQDLKINQKRLSSAVRTGKEPRMVKCVTQFHTPYVGRKCVVRTDTGEVLREEAMSDFEKQENLFARQAGVSEIETVAPEEIATDSDTDSQQGEDAT